MISYEFYFLYFKIIYYTSYNNVTIQQVVFLYTQWIKSTVKSFNN